MSMNENYESREVNSLLLNTKIAFDKCIHPVAVSYKNNSYKKLNLFYNIITENFLLDIESCLGHNIDRKIPQFTEIKDNSHIKEAIGQAADISNILLSFFPHDSKFEIPYKDLMK